MGTGKPVVLRARAQSDAYGIYDYYNEVAGKTVTDRVVSDILATLERIGDFPDSGANLENGTQMTVTTRYRFAILFKHRPERIEVLSIFRHQDRLPRP